MNVQWYPGHMTKAVRSMQEDIRLIDLIIELLDARVPVASRNPDIDRLGQGKARLILLNKADLAGAEENRRWAQHFKERGIACVQLDSRRRDGMNPIKAAVREACREKKERDLRRGIKNRPVRAMVAGIPNVGKSTFINSFAGKSVARTGNRPGVTKGKQWIRLDPELELLDTPGILWPKFEDPKVGLHLAMIGSINDEILPKEELALEILKLLKSSWPDSIRDRYGIEEEIAGAELLEAIGRRLGCLKSGGEIDLARAAGLVIDDLRSGRLGRITIEKAGEE
ncbi:MAG: ribosome biogenesis GTPase YlqF [Lachnospiraceae bacterium]|nr:ribosome biogenesis GTPase YlqF [Lachnospiraceae bacterium]